MLDDNRSETIGESFTSRELRDALGQFATGICVITINPDGHDPMGITINSFASVSLDPPLILWSIEKKAQIFPHINKADRFGVNVLAADQENLSEHYANKTRHRIDDGTYGISNHGVPLLDGCIMTLECSRHVVHDGGDHAIIIGKVTAIDVGGGIPLVFYGSNYRQLRRE